MTIARRPATLIGAVVRTLSDDDVGAISRRVVALHRGAGSEYAICSKAAAKRLGFTSVRAFQRWAKRIGLRSMWGTKGLFWVPAINQAAERATRRLGRAR
jgi:hypothetical protein